MYQLVNKYKFDNIKMHSTYVKKKLKKNWFSSSYQICCWGSYTLSFPLLLDLLKCAGFVLYAAFLKYTTYKNLEFKLDKLQGVLNLFCVCVFYLLIK